MQGRNKNVSRSILAAAAVAVSSLSAAPASAQLNYGDVVTLNSFLNTSQNGRMYRLQPNGTKTQIGADWDWNNRPLAVLVENRNTALVATGTTYATSNNYGQRLYRVDLNTGNRTLIADLNRPQGIDWTYCPTDMERNPVTGKVYLSTGIQYWSTGQGTGRIHELNTNNGQLTTIVDNLGWERAPTQLAIDPTNPTRMVWSSTWQGSSYESYHYRTDLTNPQGSLVNTSSRGWNVRVQGLEFTSNGTLYGAEGTQWNSGQNSYFSQMGNTDPNVQSRIFDYSGRRHGWPDQLYKLAYDEQNNRMWMGGSQHWNSNGSYNTSVWYRDLSTNNDVFVTDNNNQWGIVDMDVVNFTVQSTGYNNVTIGSSDSSVSGNPNFRADDSNAQVAASSIVSALSSNSNVSVRPGIAGANNQLGNVTLASAIDYNGVGANKTLTLRANNDLVLDAGIDDSVPSSVEPLAIELVGNNGGESTNTGIVDVNAPVNARGGAITISAKTFDNTGGAITGGAITLATTGSTNVGAAITGTNVSITTNGLTATAPITASGSLSITNTGATAVSATISAATLNLGSATLDVSSSLVVSSSLGTSGTLNVLPGGSVSVPSLADSIPAVTIDGGTFAITGTTALGNPGNFTFNSGTVSVAGNRTYSSSNNLAQRVMGSSVTTGKTVAIGGTLTLNSAYTINGGTLKAGNLANTFNLTFTKGTLELTNSNIAVDSTGLFGDTLQLTSGQTVVASGASTGNVNVAADGLVELNGGRLIATTAVNNAGEIRITSSASRLGGSSLLNTGVVIGSAGRVEAEVQNGDGAATPAIGEIRVGAGGNLRFTSNVANLEDGRIEATGGTVEFAAGVSNAGRILISNSGNLRLNPTNYSTNPGSIEISGNANVYGDIQNSDGFTDGGKVIVSGGGVVNFFDDIWNGPGTGNNATTPEFRISGGSAAVVFGLFKGSGNVTGQGTLVTEGVFSPGDSPRVVNFEGNLTLGQSSQTIIELAGSMPGLGGYDQLLVGGTATLGGTLDVVLLDGYRPAFGTQFEILSAGNLLGDFSATNLPGGSEYWEISRTPTGLTLTAIPEPAALMAGAIVAAAALKRRARRDARRDAR
jgi:hypothetical protein